MFWSGEDGRVYIPIVTLGKMSFRLSLATNMHLTFYKLEVKTELWNFVFHALKRPWSFAL